jgi:Alpha/beta hydrolase domain
MEWVVEDREPPPSAYPTIAAGTLVSIDRVKFPAIPGVMPPRVIHQAHRVEYGPRWPEGIITVEPPRVGKAFPCLVSQVDAVGNEDAGVRNVELLAPLATYTPWNLRGPGLANPDELTDFLGTYIPLPRTESERQRMGDPRPSLERRYPSKADYLSEVARAADTLGAARLLLPEDRQYVLARASLHWDWIMTRRP